MTWATTLKTRLALGAVTASDEKVRRGDTSLPTIAPATRSVFEDFTQAAFWAGISTFIFMVFGALTAQISVIAQFDITDAQARSWIFVTWLTTGIASVGFSLHYRQPLAIGWTIPGLVYLGSLAGQFRFEEIVFANLVAGLMILALGLLGVGSRVIHLIPVPILMAMFSASIVEFITRMVEATVNDFAVAGPMVAAYLAGRCLNKQRIPPVGLAVVIGLLPLLILDRFGTGSFQLTAPQAVFPGMAVSMEAIVSVSLPMVILVLGLGHVQGLGFLAAQGYRVPGNPITIAVGAMSVLNALLGGHPAAMTRVSSAMLGGPAAGPMAGRYCAALVAAALATTVALTTGLVVVLMAVLPPVYIYTMAGLAILGSFEDALVRAFSGGLRLGAAIAFGVTLATFSVAGIPSAFWALAAGLGASLISEREELLGLWRKANSEA